MNLILLFPEDFVDPDHAHLTGERARHIREILRASPGKKLKVGFVQEGFGEGEVTEVNSETVILRITRDSKKISDERKLSLILALPRPQTLKKVLETAGTFGISRIDLIGTERVEKSFFQSTLLKDNQWLRHLYLGMEQGSQIFFPEVQVHTSFRHFMKKMPENNQANVSRFILHPETNSTLWDFPIIQKNSQEIVCAIGPEGGWIDSEIEEFKKLGFEAIRLGQTIHRVENALTAFLSQVELMRMK